MNCLTYCSWGQLPADRPKYKGILTHYNCICGCKEMVEEIKKIIDIREKLVRMGCSPGYIDGSNGNPGIWKTILVSGWDQRTVKECLKSACLKNGKYREMDNGYEFLYDIEVAVKMKTSSDKQYLKKFEDHLNYHKTHEATKSSNQAESLRRLLGLDTLQTIRKVPITETKVHNIATKEVVAVVEPRTALKKAAPKKKTVELEIVADVIPSKAKFVVMGAGTIFVNGYYEENGIHNNKPKYRKIDANGNVVLHNGKPIEICYGSGWCMGIWLCEDKGWVYDINQDINPSLPSKEGWKLTNDGIAPFPTITFLNNEKPPIIMQKLYHGTINHESKCDDHTFWSYAHTKKLQMKWDTHLPISTYCNNHIPLVINWTSLQSFKCLGHTNSADFISAQKEWKENGWSEEWPGLDSLKHSDEPEEIFVGKKSYTYQ